MSNSACINTLADKTWLYWRFTSCVTLSPADDDGQDDDYDAKDADGDGGPVREH